MPHFCGNVTGHILDDSTSSILLQVLAGDLPFRPGDAVGFSSGGYSPKRPSWTPIPDHPLWDIVESCWEQHPDRRPRVAEILNTLTSPGMTFPEVWPSRDDGSSCLRY